MHNVQIAIQDRAYADALRHLLVDDGRHQVHIVEYPIPAIDGVVVVDETTAIQVTASEGFDFGRCVVFTRKVPIQPNQLWVAGVRYVIQADYPPHVGWLVVLAAERRLAGPAMIEQDLLFDETDRLFLQKVRISAS
jgi:hypothetical protein